MEKCKICGKEDPAGMVRHLWASHAIKSTEQMIEQIPPVVEKEEPKKKKKVEKKEEEPIEEEVLTEED